MSRRAALLAWLLLAATAGAQPLPTPPDPRRGERLDGRAAPRDPFRAPRAVGRAVLAVPRWIVEALVWPVVRLASFAERTQVVARTYWAFTSDDRLRGLRPEARYETGLVFSLGARYFDRRSLGLGSLIQLKLRTGGPRFIFGELRVHPPHGRAERLELRASFARNERQLFAGVGGDRSSELAAAGRGRASYGGDAARSALLLEWEPVAALRLGLAAELDLRTYRTSESMDLLWCAAPGTPECRGVDAALVPGFAEGLRVLRATGSIVVDSRRGRRRPAGLRLALEGGVSRGILDDPSAQVRAVADLRVLLDLGDQALILRLNGGHVTALGDAPVPFEELLSPTGNQGLRGMSSGRLRGESQLFAVAEYRWLVAPYLDASLFVEDGGAFGPGFDGLSLSRMIPGYGVGLRVHQIRGDYWNARPLFWMQVGHSPGEGSRFIIGLGSGDPD
jgi:hypothetical protein